MSSVETCSCFLCNKLYTYIYNHIVVWDKYIHSNLVYDSEHLKDSSLWNWSCVTSSVLSGVSQDSFVDFTKSLTVIGREWLAEGTNRLVRIICPPLVFIQGNSRIRIGGVKSLSTRQPLGRKSSETSDGGALRLPPPKRSPQVVFPC